MRSIALVVTLCWCPTLLWAAPPPTRIDLDSEHSRPSVADEPRPKVGSKLPFIEIDKQPKPSPKPKPKPVAKKVQSRRRAPLRKARPKQPGFRVQVDFGWISVPRSLVSFAAQVNQFPDLGAYTLDVSVLRTGRGHHDFGGRLGLTFPQVPAANWYLSTEGAKRPVYTEVDLVGVDLAFTYQYRRLLIGPLGINLRAGAGLTIAAGSVKRVQVLPTCAPDEYARCPHWREAATEPNALPSVIWPALRGTAGVFLQFNRFSVSFDAGIRNAIYVGGGLSVSL